jgi:hypothetical protein
VKAEVDGVTHTFVCMVPALCGLLTHQPLVGLLWEMAWADLGQCVTLDVCPLVNWVLNTVYDVGATVMVTSSGGNHTFICRVDDLCGLANYQPLVGRLWRQAWSDLGVCGDMDTTSAGGFDLVLAGQFDTEAREDRTFGTMAAAEEFEAQDSAAATGVSAKGEVFFTPLVGKIAAGAAGMLFAMVAAMGVLIGRERRRWRNQPVQYGEECSTI